MDTRIKDLEELRSLLKELECLESYRSYLKNCHEYKSRCETKIRECLQIINGDVNNIEVGRWEGKHSTDNAESRKTKCLEEEIKRVEKRSKKLLRFRRISILLVAAVFVFLVGTAVLVQEEAKQYFGFTISQARFEELIKVGTVLLGASVALLVVSILAIRGNRCRGNFSLKQKAWIKEGKKIDEENRRKNQEAKRVEACEEIQKNRNDLKQVEIDILDTENNCRQQEKTVDAMHVLAKKDKNVPTVSFLIERLESRRANSIQEALLQYDAKRKAEMNYQFQRDMARLQYEQEAQRRLEESEDRLRQSLHNREMEKQARRVAEEIEEMRKDDEYYRKYGRTRSGL